MWLFWQNLLHLLEPAAGPLPYNYGMPDEAHSADAIGLVEKVIAVTQRFLCVLIDRDGDRLDVLVAVALARRALTQLGKRGDPGRAAAFSSYHRSVSTISSSGRQAHALW